MKSNPSRFTTREKLQAGLIRALSLDAPYSKRPIAQKKGAPASVLILFSMMEFEPGILITKRTDQVETHKGQMAFPGGVRENEDLNEIVTALRETEEELGVSSEVIEVLGKLPELSTFTGFVVTPIVGLVSLSPERILLSPNAHEIEEAFWVPLSQFLAPGVYKEEYFQIGSVRYPVSVFQWGDYRVWGATGVMIKNLLDRLESLS